MVECMVERPRDHGLGGKCTGGLVFLIRSFKFEYLNQGGRVTTTTR